MSQRFVAIHEAPQDSIELRNLLHGDFRPGTDAAPPGVKDRSRQRLVRKPQGLAEGSLTSRGSGSRRNRGTPLPAPPSGSSPETPPHERGCEPYYKLVT